MANKYLTPSQEFCLRRLGEEHFLTKRELSAMAKNAQVTKRSVWWDWAAGPLRDLRLMGLVDAMDDIPGTRRKKFFLTDLGKTKLKEMTCAFNSRSTRCWRSSITKDHPCILA